MLLAYLGLGGVSSCLYDSGNRCDAGQTFDSGSGLCICDESKLLVAGDHGCVACAAGQIVKDGACACPDGSTLTGTTCTLDSLPCASDADCTDSAHATCHLDAGKTGYCTNTGCATSNDCATGLGCNTSADPSFCQQPPTGQGKACTSGDDCAGTDATYCESFNSHTCFVEGCKVGGSDCFAGYECCDLGPLSGGIVQKKICVTSGSCGT